MYPVYATETFNKIYDSLDKSEQDWINKTKEKLKENPVVEVKDYMAKDISISQIKQLNKYLQDLNCNIGLLICHRKPKKDRFIIKDNKIFIFGDFEINKIPQLIDGDIV